MREFACCYIASSSIEDLALGALSLVPCPATVYDALTPRQGCTRNKPGWANAGLFSAGRALKNSRLLKEARSTPRNRAPLQRCDRHHRLPPASLPPPSA